MRILGWYAEQGNRELYWNYLAQHVGSDGYGLLALGVVRNDNMPGAVANNFAQNHARRHDDRVLTEREWEQFGQDLLVRDLERRQYWVGKDRPDLALNLPVKDVQSAHDASFERARIDPNTWTPRQLLEAARRQGGEEAAEGVWHAMLDNNTLGLGLGIGRAGITLGDIVRYDDDQLPALRYTGALAGASAMASQDRPATDPDVIGAAGFYHLYDRNAREWSTVSGGGIGGPVIRRVTDPERIAELDDARAVRLERQEKARQFHPLDPARERGISESPWTLADAGDPSRAARIAMSDPTRPDHPDHHLYLGSRDAVHRLDASLGRAPDRHSGNMIASLACLARRNGLERIDHVVLGGPTKELRPGENVFVVQGRLDDPAHLRAHMKTQLAVDTPAADSLRELQALDQAAQARTQQAQAATAELAVSELQRVAPMRMG
ncbi:XVIPCD domain-containing protein [Luteimonas soli]|uniref:XVIPCD domain-containing protein n=1 Tax=Luteimonas soli TaxID=1648966 RepID=A0ABV7XLS1_9GAMM